MFAKRETDIPEFGGKCPSCGHTKTAPPVPVDTISIKREVLQGVRETLLEAYSILESDYRGQTGLDLTHTDLLGRTAKVIASLDAVLSEGK